MTTRLEKFYKDEVVPKLMKQFGYDNVMQVPRITKIALNMFSGGALHRFSLFALNVVPYISASIIVQLMGQIYGPWKAMRNEGESGRRKLTQYSRIGAVFLAVVQSYGIATALQAQGAAYDQGIGFVLTAMAGTKQAAAVQLV